VPKAQVDVAVLSQHASDTAVDSQRPERTVPDFYAT
jgi:hypothetical protein